MLLFFVYEDPYKRSFQELHYLIYHIKSNSLLSSLKGKEPLGSFPLSDFHFKECVASRATGGMLSFLPWKSQNGLAMRAFAIHSHLAVAPLILLQAAPFAHTVEKLQKKIIFSLPFHDIFRKKAPHCPHKKERFDTCDNEIRKRKSL